MIPGWRALAALLLVSTSSAQTRRAAVPSLTPLTAVVAPKPPLSVSALTPVTPLAEPATPVSRSAARAAAIRTQNAASSFKRSKAPAAEAAPDFGRALFDGTDPGATRSGSVFNYSRSGKYFFLAQQSPKAAARTYPATQQLSGADLLHHLTTLATADSRPLSEQVAHRYGAASDYLFSVIDNHMLKGVRGVTDAYSGVFIPGTSTDGKDYSECTGCENMNVEHVFPQSFFGSKKPMVSDVHMLMATLEHPNSIRGRLPFGPVREADYSNKAGAKRGNGRFEPPNFSKGRVARKMLYSFIRYHDYPFFQRTRTVNFWNAQIAILLDWNRRYPPTIEEAAQNDHAEKFQGNRNPFVDDPSLADRIGAAALALEAPAPDPLRRRVDDQPVEPRLLSGAEGVRPTGVGGPKLVAPRRNVRPTVGRRRHAGRND
jgi:hypothetical protein